jgi:hypothetical protein
MSEQYRNAWSKLGNQDSLDVPYSNLSANRPDDVEQQAIERAKSQERLTANRYSQDYIAQPVPQPKTLWTNMLRIFGIVDR